MGRGLSVSGLLLGVACAACASGGVRPDPTRGPREQPDPSGAIPTERSTDDRTTGDRSTADRPRLVGGCGPAPAALQPLYSLPFTVGDGYTLTQGNCGGASHTGRFSYAFDFAMPVGTPIVAARDGVVFTLRADRPDGTGRVGDENFVIVEHPDGEFSRYIHLRRAGVLVQRGDVVRQGDTIALSGHSGRSAFPHLHFDVAEACRAGPCQTVPSAFINAEPPIPDARRPVSAGVERSR